MLRRLKLTYALYNLFHKNLLNHNVPLLKKLGIKKAYFSPLSSEDFKHLETDLNWLDKENSKNLLPGNRVFENQPTAYKEALLNWSDNGFAILPGFFNAEEVDRINAEVEGLLEAKKIHWKGNKLMFAIKRSKYLMDTGKSKRLTEILEMLLGRKVKLFQSINFYNGSQQPSHSDSVHMTTYPYGNLIAVWIALEDVEPEQGALHYYPGSHKLPYVMNSDYNNVGSTFLLGKKDYPEYEAHIRGVLESNPAYRKKIFSAKKGDMLIWHANLIHGGEPHTNKSKGRKSMVFHYFAEGAICYHEVTQRPALISPA